MTPPLVSRSTNDLIPALDHNDVKAYIEDGTYRVKTLSMCLAATTTPTDNLSLFAYNSGGYNILCWKNNSGVAGPVCIGANSPLSISTIDGKMTVASGTVTVSGVVMLQDSVSTNASKAITPNAVNGHCIANGTAVHGLGSMSTVASPCPIGNGGTGAVTATDAATNILPMQTGHNTHVLTSNGTTCDWAAGGSGSSRLSVFSQSSENCDATHPVIVRIYVPTGYTSVAAARMKLIINQYRRYTNVTSVSPTGAGGTHTHTYSANQHRHDIAGTGVTAISTSSGGFGNFTDTSHLMSYANWRSAFNSSTICNAQTNSGSYTAYVTTSGTNDTAANHTHTISDPTLTDVITDASQTSPSIGVGYDGTTFATYTADQADIDVSAQITSSGWHFFSFTPNQIRRLDCSIYVQVNM